MTWMEQAEVEAVLSPYHDELRACVDGGWNKWMAEIRPLYPRPTRRLRANAIWDGMVDEARIRFSDLPSVAILDRGDRFFLTFDGRILVRFKKLDDRLRTRNFPTQYSLTIDAQLNLPAVPDGSMLTVGYIVDELALELRDVLVVMSRSNQVLWAYSIQPSSANAIVPLAPRQGPLPLDGTNRFRRPERREGQASDE